MKTFDIRNVQIRTRMYGLVVVFLLFVLVIGVLGLVFIQGIRSDVSDLYQHPFQVKNAIVNTNVKIHHIQKLIQDYVFAKDLDTRARITSNIEQLYEEIDSHFLVVKDNYLGDIEDYRHLHREFHNWYNVNMEILRNTNEYSLSERHDLINKKEEILEPLFRLMGRINEFSESKALEFYQQSNTRHIRYQMFFAGIFLLLLIFFLFAARCIVRSIIEPVLALSSSAEKIRNGNMVINKPEIIRDEIDQLADTFAEMTRKLIDSNRELGIRVDERTKELETEINRNKETLTNLRKSEQLFRSVFDSDLFGAIFWRGNGEITQANDHYLNLLGITREEFDRNGLNWRTVTPAEDIIGEEDRLKNIREGSIKPFRKKYVHKDGHFTYVLVGAAMVSEDPFLGIAFVIDITEQVKSEQKLEDYKDGLEDKIKERTQTLETNIAMVDESRKALTFLLEDVNDSRVELERVNLQLDSVNKELEAFSYSVSHDLKAPLRAIDGFSLALFEDYYDRLDGEAKEYINLIRNNAQKMGQLIKDLLEFSRMGRKAVSTEMFSVEKLAKEVFDDLTTSMKDRTIDLIIESNADINADRSMIKQVMINLLSNAIKFTRTRDTGEIRVGCNILEKDIEVYVKDNGVGFDMAYLDKLFGVFQRLHSDDDFEGTGVGLALVKRIITKHQGTIRAEGEVDKGASFFMTFPIPSDKDEKTNPKHKEDVNG